MKQRPIEHKTTVVTGLGDDREALLGERSIDRLLEVLCLRANRLVNDREICERLRPVFREFVRNLVDYFHDSGELDEFVLTNIMTALITADAHGPSPDGVEDYSTFIRSLNPTDPDAGRFFVIGRAGGIDDPGCPLSKTRQGPGGLANVPDAKLHMFHAFHYARSMDPSRDAPRIPVQDFWKQVPDAIFDDPELEAAFLDVCFSDGAWELYQLEQAAA